MRFSSLLPFCLSQGQMFPPHHPVIKPSLLMLLNILQIYIHISNSLSYIYFNKTAMYNTQFLVPKESFGQHITAMRLANNCQLTSILQPPDHDHTVD
jgi:hypothetical protein